MKLPHIDGYIDIYDDYLVIDNAVNGVRQITHILYSQISFLQLHNGDSFSTALSSIEFKMKNDIKLEYIPTNKIYFSSITECKFVFDKLFTAYRVCQNNH